LIEPAASVNGRRYRPTAVVALAERTHGVYLGGLNISSQQALSGVTKMSRI
jgi:hypothetical protein